MLYFKKGNTVLEYKNKRELYKNIGFYDIATVGIWHSYKKTARHYGEVAITYMERVKSKEIGLDENLCFSNGRIIFESTGWNIFDENGVYYSILDFIEYYEEYSNNRIQFYINNKYESWNGSGAVPGTGKSGRSCYFYNRRYPKIYNELRNNQITVEDEYQNIRAKRKIGNLINFDYFSGKYQERSWKSYRNNQYKGE
jgi:hypothetical protein